MEMRMTTASLLPWGSDAKCLQAWRLSARSKDQDALNRSLLRQIRLARDSDTGIPGKKRQRKIRTKSEGADVSQEEEKLKSAQIQENLKDNVEMMDNEQLAKALQNQTGSTPANWTPPKFQDQPDTPVVDKKIRNPFEIYKDEDFILFTEEDLKKNSASEFYK